MSRDGDLSHQPRPAIAPSKTARPPHGLRTPVVAVRSLTVTQSRTRRCASHPPHIRSKERSGQPLTSRERTKGVWVDLRELLGSGVDVSTGRGTPVNGMPREPSVYKIDDRTRHQKGATLPRRS